MPNPHLLIRQAVEASDLTHAQIGDALGLHRTSVTSRLVGRTRWSVDDVLALATLLEVPLSRLVEGP